MTRSPIRILAQPPDRSILVTGGEDFVRAALCNVLAQNPALRVISLAQGVTAGRPVQLDNYWDVQGDLADGELVTALLAEARVDAVVRLAPAADEAIGEGSNASAQSFLQSVLEHWRHLSGDGRARFRLVDVSNDAILGGLPADRNRFTPLSPYRPSSPGAAAQAATALLARSWHAYAGLPVILATHGNVYGPGQDSGAFVPRAILSAVAGDPVDIRGTGAETRDWLHVDDLAQALRQTLLNGQPGAAYLIGGRAERSRIAVAAMICDILDRFDPWPDGRRRRSLIRFTADRPEPDQRRALDPGDVERAVGWQAAVPFPYGLAETVDWYRRPPVEADVPARAALR